MRNPRFSLVGLLLAALPFAAGIGCSKSESASPRISAGGATFVDPIMQKWSAEYKKAKNVEIDYVSKGSGYGISNVTSRNLDFGCSDAPMNGKENDAAKAAGGDVVHIPVTIGAVAIVYNLPEVKDLKLSGEVLADIYLRKITKWNDGAIAKLNPGAALPDRDITPVARAESSGTSSIFTEYLSKRNGGFASKVGASKSPKWPAAGVLGKDGNDGVAGHVKDAAGTIGYVELAYAKKNGIAFATLINKAGKPVTPDAAGVTAAVEAAMKVKQDKEPYSLHPLTFSFTDADGDSVYPIVGASYAMVFKKQPKDKGTVIVDFLKWVVADGQQFAKDLDYAPLPGDLTKKAQELLGTVTFE
ncbi:MAG: phosphate ABC transporter substrate-binding protein PstS [Planctomycetaceae bacterium]|nr:phosphate ABC transporter substrate-binding protein PstS [Planctomycetaceae bacterium]